MPNCYIMFALKYYKHINKIVKKKVLNILVETTKILDLLFILHVVSKCMYD